MRSSAVEHRRKNEQICMPPLPRPQKTVQCMLGTSLRTEKHRRAEFAAKTLDRQTTSSAFWTPGSPCIIQWSGLIAPRAGASLSCSDRIQTTNLFPTPCIQAWGLFHADASFGTSSFGASSSGSSFKTVEANKLSSEIGPAPATAKNANTIVFARESSNS